MSKAYGIAVLLLAGCGAPPPPFQTKAKLGDIMHAMVIPNADLIWDASGTIITLEKTEERRPKNEDEWIQVEAAATTLMEAGNSLMMEGRAKDKGQWYEKCKAMIAAAESVRTAAKARDVDALFTRGGDLFDTCQSCHFTYRFEKDPTTIRTH